MTSMVFKEKVLGGRKLPYLHGKDHLLLTNRCSQNPALEESINNLDVYELFAVLVFCLRLFVVGYQPVLVVLRRQAVKNIVYLFVIEIFDRNEKRYLNQDILCII